MPAPKVTSDPRGRALGRKALMAIGATQGPVPRVECRARGGAAATGAVSGDADGSGGPRGTGGSAAGGGATGGAADPSGGARTGAAGESAARGGAGNATASGACTSASGVVALSVPLTAIGEGQRYNYQNYDGIGSYDLTGATLDIVACAPAATAGNLHVFFTTLDRNDSTAFDVALSSLTTGFQTISISVPAASGQFDPGTIMVTRVEIEAGDGFGTSWQQPATVVVIDSISTSNGLFNDTFDEDIAPLQHSGARVLSGATITWADE